MSTQDTIHQIKTKLADAWLRGQAQRIEIGTLLLELRAKAEHGDWGKWMAELGIPASTAADYMQEASRQIHGIRVFVNGAVKDDEAAQMQQAVATAAAAVNGDNFPEPPVPPQPERAVIELSEHVRVSGPVLFCSADQKAAYKAAKKDDPERVRAIFQNALLAVIGEQEEVRDEALAA